jgi:GPI mannosyltransferase 3
MSFLARPRNVFVTGVLLIVTTAWFSVGYHHPDEHYQIWEFAKYKLGEAPLEDLPWEYHERMRPGLQPFIAYVSILGARLVGITDPFHQAFLLRLSIGLLVFGLYWKWCAALAPTLRDGGRLLQLSVVFFWMLPYLNVRFSSENTAALTFLSGLLLLYPTPFPKSGRALLLAGFLLGLSFFFRYQIAFAGVGLGAWLLWGTTTTLRQWGGLVVGALVAVAIGFATDYWLYHDWVFAPYNYFAQNIVEDKAAGFGVSPWWWYFTEMPVLLLPPVSVLLFVFMGVGIKRSPQHVFVWCLVPFVIGHSLVGHKESRFLFPMIFPMFYLAALGWDWFTTTKPLARWLKTTFTVCVVINAIALLYRSLYPANDLVVFLRFMRQYAENHPGTTIYWEKKGPTKKEKLTPHFYQSPWMNIAITDTLTEMNNPTLYHPKSGDLIYFRTENPVFVPSGFQTERVYRWYPDWLLQFNPNNWQDRTRIWSVYQIK